MGGTLKKPDSHLVAFDLFNLIFSVANTYILARLYLAHATVNNFAPITLELVTL